MTDDHAETTPFVGYVATAASRGLKTQERMARSHGRPGHARSERQEHQAAAVVAEGLNAFLDALSYLMGGASVLGFLDDEHERYWPLYAAANGDGSKEADLLECLRLDPDPAMSSSVLFSMLDAKDPAGRRALLAFAPAGSLDRLAGRAAELDLRDEVLAGGGEGSAGDLLVRLLEASNGIQLSIAEKSSDSVLLRGLTDDGRTKRVRHVASEKPRRLGRS